MPHTHGIDVPYISDELLATLDEKFPDRCPTLQDTDRMIWYKAGQRSVVAYLKDQHRRMEAADRNTGLSGLYMDTQQ